MHDGKDSENYLKRGFKVIAFEANPYLCEDARKRFDDRGYAERIDIRNRAVSHHQCESVSFFINGFNSAWSSLDSQLGHRNGDASEVLVPTCDLREELSGISPQIHMAKIDIEGADLIALQQLMKLAIPPKYLSAENGNPRMVRLLAESGYAEFAFSNQMNVPQQVSPQDSTHGHPVEHTFFRGSSGLFGEDLNLKWRNTAEALLLSEALSTAMGIAPNNLFAETVGWFDLHARHSWKKNEDGNASIDPA